MHREKRRIWNMPSPVGATGDTIDFFATWLGPGLRAGGQPGFRRACGGLKEGAGSSACP